MCRLTPSALLLPALLAALLPAPLQADLKTLDWARCGVKGHAKRRIVNGKDAEECVWRWQVSINSNSYGQFCGGTLIDESWVLTAAHCVASVKSHCAVRNLRIRAGAHVRRQDMSDDHTVERQVTKVFVHPLYQKNVKHDYDFALLKLDKAVPLNRCIGTACLPSENRCGEVETGCSITGWGTLHSQGRTPEVLQEAPVKVFPTEACEKNYSKTKDAITASMMCAKGRSEAGNITDSCQGDSGGPLVCTEEGSDGWRYVLRGVTSWGQGCALEGFPGVYARVTSSLPWIIDVMDGKVRRPDVEWTEEEIDLSDLDFKGQMWAIMSGECQMDEDGCISSPGFEEGLCYDNNQRCLIAVKKSVAVPIRVENFSTEEFYDYVIVNCKKYSGSDGPDGVVPESSILWVSDASKVEDGWKLCPAW